MLKKILYISIIILFFLLTNQTVSAKEYCNIFENDELKDTIELPFYFYKVKKEVDISTIMPTISYEKEETYIDSLTKCENIKVTIVAPDYPLGNSLLVDYSKTSYTISNEDIFLNAKFNTNNSIIKGYSKILDEEPPIFKGYKEKYTTNINNPLDLNIILNNIHAYDEREGNLTKNIVIEYDDYSNNKTLGTHLIILSVKDSANNKNSLNISIEIIDNSPPIIEGKNNFISYLSSPLTIEAIQEQLTVKDNVNTNLESQLYPCTDNYSINKNNVGFYSLYFCVYDFSSNLSNPYQVTIEVKDDIPPIIEGTNYFTSKLSNPLTIEQIMYSLTAHDNHQDISSSIYIKKDLYSNYLNTIGEKSIIFQAMDNYQNVSLPFEVKIKLEDDIAPQIFGLDTYNSYLSSPLSLTYIKQQLTIIDNVDINLYNNLKIIEDTYTNNLNKTGKYYLIIQTEDHSNNLSEPFKITITNIDDVSPYITGVQTLTYSFKNKPSTQEILNLYQSKDNVDQNLPITIESDTYTASQALGTYYIQLSTIDTSNNKSPIFQIEINLVDSIALKDNILYVSTKDLLSMDTIASIINLTTPYTIIEDTYTPNYANEGTYKINYELENSNFTITIKTYTEQTPKIVTEQKKETFFQKIKSFFQKIMQKIKSFFKKLKFINIFLKYQ